MADADSGSDVKHRMTRSDVNVDVEPGFWPSRGRRSNYEDTQPPLRTNSEKSRIVLPHWRSEGVRNTSELCHNMNTLRLRLLLHYQ